VDRIRWTWTPHQGLEREDRSGQLGRRHRFFRLPFPRR
jgi:hypothetical protein